MSEQISGSAFNNAWKLGRKQGLREAADAIERLSSLVRLLLENDPDDMAAKGITVLDVWRKEARRALKQARKE